MPLVSVIIPVYKVEKYLSQCVDSIINQHLDDIEVILVDDGSPDNSPEICDDYAEKYDYIRVIHKENGGLSSARNTGIKSANGKFLMFMDSDDWWNPKVDVCNMFNYVKQHDDTQMFLFTSFDYLEGKGYYQRNEHRNFSDIDVGSVENYYRSLLNNGNMEVSACTKILDKQFVYSNKLFFSDGLLGEDNEWTIRVLRKLKKVDIINQPLYICRADRSDSITHTISKKNIEDLLKIVSNSLEYYSENSDNESIREMELCFASYLWFSALGLSNSLDKKALCEVKSLFWKTRSVCKYSRSKKTKLCNAVYRVLGFNLTVKVLGKYIDLKGKNDMNKTKVELK